MGQGVQALADWLQERDSRLVTGANLETWLSGQTSNTWTGLLREPVAEYAPETGNSGTPAESFVQRLAEWGRRKGRQRGLPHLTAHRAFDNAVVPGWGLGPCRAGTRIRTRPAACTTWP